MSFQDSQVGSLNGSYWEYVNRVGDDSPRANKVPRPGLPADKATYSQWNKYQWTRRSYRGSVVAVSRNPPGPYFRPDVYVSAYYLGEQFAPGAASAPDTWKILSKLVQKWKNTDFNLGVSVFEGKESFSMIAEKLMGLAQAAKALRRGNLGGAIRHFHHPVPRKHRKRAAARLKQGDISGSWLALNLGWAPMIQDIYAGLEYAGSEGGYAIIRTPWVKGSIQGTPGGGSVPANFVRKSEQYRSRVVCEVRTPPQWYDRLGLTNPAEIAWELVPFSFVVDYFLPIGQSIEALSALRIDKGRMMQETRIKVTANYSSLPKGTYLGGLWLYTDKPTTRHSYRSYVRSLTSVTDLMVVKRASISLPTSLKRLANISALLHQQLLGIKLKSTFTR